jgi:hypothetical protein
VSPQKLNAYRAITTYGYFLVTARSLPEAYKKARKLSPKTLRVVRRIWTAGVYKPVKSSQLGKMYKRRK